MRKKKAVTKKKTAKKKAAPTVSLRSAEVREVARDLTTLALVRMEQGGSLNVRQRENLRRALAEAGETLGWVGTAVQSDDPVAAAVKDLKKIVKSGAKSLEREVADELAMKKTEASRLEAVVETVQELAEDPNVEYPTQITYSHTAQDAVQGLITKTETVTVSDAKEALDAAQAIEKSMNKWGRLREQMLDELKQTQKNLGVLTNDLSHFVDSGRGLLREVLVTLH